MASQATGMVVELDQVQNTLLQLVSTITQDVQHTLCTTEDPVNIDATWLANRVHQDFHGSYQVFSNNDPSASQELNNAEAKLSRGLGALIRLPREIRDLVFAEPIAAGSVDFARASKALGVETSELVAKNGICRLAIGFPRHHELHHNPNIPQRIADRIQNVYIRVNSGAILSTRPARQLALLERFQGSRVARKSCRVVFECFFDTHRMACSDVLEVVKTYTGFEEVAVKIAVENERSLKETMPSLHVCRFLRDRDDSMLMVLSILDPVLGVGVWGREDGNTIITYHPRKHVAEKGGDADILGDLGNGSAEDADGIATDEDANDEDEGWEEL